MIRLGVVGTGGMANQHAKKFHEIKDVKLVACCDISRERAETYAKTHGVEKVYDNYKTMFKEQAKHLDGVTIVTTDATHYPVAVAALKSGLNVLCEKPLCVTLRDAASLAKLAKASRKINMVNFSYRDSCALQAMAEAVKSGKIGRIMHVEASYLQSWLSSKIWGDWKTTQAFLWRLSTKHGSNGCLGDVGVHIYDFLSFVAGDIETIGATLKTFKKQVPGERMGEYILDANDGFVAQLGLKNGAIGVLHSTRWASGQANSLRLRVYGDKGAVEIDLDKSWETYRACLGKNLDTATWEEIKAKPTPNNYQRFVSAIRSGKNDPCDFASAVKVQAYLHYTMESSKLKKPVKVKV